MAQLMLWAAAALFMTAASACAQEGDDASVTTSCSLFVKATVSPSDSTDRFGKAVIEATLCDKQGVPIPDQEIRLTSSCGKFFCPPPDSALSPDYSSCYITGQDGRIKVELTAIPFNTAGRVVATCTYGTIKVKASSTFSIKRNMLKKKVPKKSPQAQAVDH
jgi:hypothetical protein